MPGSQPPAINQTIAFARVADLERTKQFYSKAFGLRQVYERAGKVVIFQATGESFFGFVPGKPATGGDCSGAFTLLVNDADSWFTHLQAAGVSNKGAPIYKDEFGIYVIYATDPDGYTVEVMEMRAKEWPQLPSA